jgi:hypothetical protein
MYSLHRLQVPLKYANRSVTGLEYLVSFGVGAALVTAAAAAAYTAAAARLDWCVATPCARLCPYSWAGAAQQSSAACSFGKLEAFIASSNCALGRVTELYPTLQLYPPGLQAKATAGCAGGGAACAAGGPAVERRQCARHRGDAGAEGALMV